ncbi:hypothetical protein [Thalassoglobus neptunius]|nr:hypothetical protein [Thalassoglobus neptunius]
MIHALASVECEQFAKSDRIKAAVCIDEGEESATNDRINYAVGESETGQGDDFSRINHAVGGVVPPAAGGHYARWFPSGKSVRKEQNKRFPSFLWRGNSPQIGIDR